jgi:CRISPR-associated endonuclease Csn1
MADYVLGLDIGSNSIGWALIPNGADESAGPRDILTGVRVFPEGLDNLNQKKEQPRGQQRRQARGARRTHQRRSGRKRRLRTILRDKGLLPSFPGPGKPLPELWRTDPYALRKRGLDEALTLPELGRVLYHLCQRRGFKSNRKSKKRKEDGQIAKEAGELQKRIDEAGCRTLGEYLARLEEVERIRDRYTLRAMYEREFDALWAAQQPHHPQVLTEELKEQVHGAIFYQRPITWRAESIGECELEPGEKRAPQAHWLAQQFRVLQEVNNLRVIAEGGEERPLAPNERAKLVAALTVKRNLAFDKIRGLLGFGEWQTFNLESQGKRSALRGNLAGAALNTRKLRKWYEAAGPELRERVHDALAEVEDENELARLAREQWDLDDEQVAVLLGIKLPTGRSRLSLKAIRRVLPFLKAGLVFSEAKEKAGYALRVEPKLARLLPPVDEALPNLTNPLVRRGLTELRKVVNALVREHGTPREVVIELARDLKNSKQRRREIEFDNRRHRDENEAVRNRLVEEFNIPHPSRDDVIRYKLWEECGRICPYTGRCIGQTALFSGEFQVEHILPYSRTLDDSYMNKTLCEANENRTRKHDRTPYEAYHDDAERYEAILKRVQDLPYPKRRRFTQKEVEIDKFVQRQLNDTRYMSRAARDYLRTLGCAARCVKGQTTAELRHQWGLDLVEGLEGPVAKAERTDHRHHAIDAAVIAMTTRSALQRLSTVKYAPDRPQLAPPWESFREDVARAVTRISVSYRPRRKIAGKLHEETFYAPTDEPDAYAVRVPVADLTANMVDNIRDDPIRSIVKGAMLDASREKGFELRGQDTLRKVLGDRILTMPSGVPIRRVRVRRTERTLLPLGFDAEGRPIKAVKPGGNHHVEIYEAPDGTWSGRAVSRFEAHQRLQRGEPVVCREPEEALSFVMSLCVYDMVMLDTGAGVRLYRVQKQSVVDGRPYLVFRLHTASRIEDDATMARATSWTTLKAWGPRKAAVDPLGRILPCND